MSEQTHGLTPSQQDAWEEYLRHERDRIHSVSLASLDAFIRSLGSTPVNVYRTWATDLAARVVDHGESIPVRMPLFKSVVFPALLSGYNERLPNYARWLSGFANLLYHCEGCAGDLDIPPTEIALLRRALEDKPEDERAYRRLIHRLADQLDYAVHEIPAGVLWGMRGATPEECAKLRDELSEFKHLAERAGMLQDYRDLINECQLHFEAYETYLHHQDTWSSYEAFLDAEIHGWRNA